MWGSFKAAFAATLGCLAAWAVANQLSGTAKESVDRVYDDLEDYYADWQTERRQRREAKSTK